MGAAGVAAGAWGLFLTAGPAGSVETAPVTIAFVQVPRGAPRPAGGAIDQTILATRYLAGMRVSVAEYGDIPGTVRTVTDGFACATDPVFSHDGRLAFAGKRTAAGPMQVWERAPDETESYALVAEEADAVSPVYLPDGRLVFASLRASEYEEHGGRLSFSLYELAPGMDTPTRLTFNPSSDFDPAVQPDGRLVYSSWQHVGNHHWPRGVVALMLMNSDGTGLFPLTGNHRGPWWKAAPTPFATDRIAFVQADEAGTFGEGALMATSLNDPFGAFEVLVPREQYEVAGMAALPGGALLVSARPIAEPRSTFGLYEWRAGVLSLLYDDPMHHELAPAVSPPGRFPELRYSTVVPDTPYGYVVILDCRETDRRPQGPFRPGAVTRVRVLQGLPLRRGGGGHPTFFAVPGREDEPLVRPNSATGTIPTRILGEVPPAEDGSVYLKVPADRPLRIQLLDRRGFALMDERAWFWVRPNERRVCIGCHANRELAPLNTTPLATRAPPVDLTDPARWETVSFRADVQPILDASCAVSGCHVPPKPTADLNLHGTVRRLDSDTEAPLADAFGPAYANLLRRQDDKSFAVGGRLVHPGNARRSPLLWWLYGRPLAPQHNAAPFERPMLLPHPSPPLSEDDVAQSGLSPEALETLERAQRTPLPVAQRGVIAKWIDLGAPYDDVAPAGPWPYTMPPPGMMQASAGAD